MRVARLHGSEEWDNSAVTQCAACTSLLLGWAGPAGGGREREPPQPPGAPAWMGTEAKANPSSADGLRHGGVPFQNRLPRSGFCKFGRNLISLVLLLTESKRMKINDCWEGQTDSLSHSPVNFHLGFGLSSGLRGVKASNL